MSEPRDRRPFIVEDDPPGASVGVDANRMVYWGELPERIERANERGAPLILFVPGVDGKEFDIEVRFLSGRDESSGFNYAIGYRREENQSTSESYVILYEGDEPVLRIESVYVHFQDQTGIRSEPLFRRNWSPSELVLLVRDRMERSSENLRFATDSVVNFANRAGLLPETDGMLRELEVLGLRPSPPLEAARRRVYAVTMLKDWLSRQIN